MNRVRIKSVDEPAFASCWELYEKSFPVYERRRMEEQAEVMNEPDYFFEALYQAGRFVGIMLYWEHKDFIYLEHFAVAPDMRGGGMGTKALDMLMGSEKPVILEIDPPEDEISRRRLGFYQRMGLAENDYKHIHPPYRLEFTGHKLEVMSEGGPLSPRAYNDFVLFLNNRVMAYSEQEK